MVDQRWVFVVKAQDKPGALTAAASVFSNRGVSLDTILGSGMTPVEAEGGRIVLSFCANEHRKDMLLRVLQRLSSILQVQAYPYSSPELRAIGVIRVDAKVDVSASEVQIEIISNQGDSKSILVTGGPPAVETMIESLREQNALLDVVITVMAV